MTPSAPRTGPHRAPAGPRSALGPLALALALAPLLLPRPAAAADLIWSPPAVAGGAVDSAAILAGELAAAGRPSVTVGSIAGLDLAPYDAVWVTLGVHPNARALTLAEGEQLRQFLLAGGALFVEGGDVWGYDPITPLHTIDGIAGIADGVGDLFAIEGLSTTNGGTFGALAASHTGENSFIDRIAADEPGAAVVLRRSGGGYGVGVLHAGALSGFPDFRFLGQSFEFGGWGGDRAALLAQVLDALGFGPPCSLAAPAIASCAATPDGVEIAWQNLAPATSLEIVRDGTTIAILAPAATSFLDTAAPVGPHEYRVRAIDGSCSALSFPCAVDTAVAPSFIRGDANGSGVVDISDPVRILLVLFGNAPPFACPDAADADDSGAIDIADPISLLLALYQGGPPIPGGGNCAADATADPLPSCASFCIP